MAEKIFDLALDIAKDGSGVDFIIENGDLKLDYGLETLVITSVFCDGRASGQDVPPLKRGEDPRGYPLDVPGDRWGSLLWLLGRGGKVTPETLDKAKQYVTESLRWIVTDGIARSIAVEVEALGINGVAIAVTFERPVGGQWLDVWKAQEAISIAMPGATLKILAN